MITTKLFVNIFGGITKDIYKKNQTFTNIYKDIHLFYPEIPWHTAFSGFHKP